MASSGMVSTKAAPLLVFSRPLIISGNNFAAQKKFRKGFLR